MTHIVQDLIYGKTYRLPWAFVQAGLRKLCRPVQRDVIEESNGQTGSNSNNLPSLIHGNDDLRPFALSNNKKQSMKTYGLDHM